MVPWRGPWSLSSTLSALFMGTSEAVDVARRVDSPSGGTPTTVTVARGVDSECLALIPYNPPSLELQYTSNTLLGFYRDIRSPAGTDASQVPGGLAAATNLGLDLKLTVKPATFKCIIDHSNILRRNAVLNVLKTCPTVFRVFANLLSTITATPFAASFKYKAQPEIDAICWLAPGTHVQRYYVVCHNISVICAGVHGDQSYTVIFGPASCGVESRKLLRRTASIRNQHLLSTRGTSATSSCGLSSSDGFSGSQGRTPSLIASSTSASSYSAVCTATPVDVQGIIAEDPKVFISHTHTRPLASPEADAVDTSVHVHEGEDEYSLPPSFLFPTTAFAVSASSLVVDAPTSLPTVYHTIVRGIASQAVSDRDENTVVEAALPGTFGAVGSPGPSGSISVPQPLLPARSMSLGSPIPEKVFYPPPSTVTPHGSSGIVLAAIQDVLPSPTLSLSSSGLSPPEAPSSKIDSEYCNPVEELDNFVPELPRYNEGGDARTLSECPPSPQAHILEPSADKSLPGPFPDAAARETNRVTEDQTSGPNDTSAPTQGLFLRTERAEYAIQQQVGDGGFGTVMLARKRNGKAVAIKVVKNDGNTVERMALERLRENRGNLQFLLTLQDFYEDKHRLFFVTRIFCESLSKYICRAQSEGNPLSRRRRDVAKVLGGLVRSLVEIHGRGIIHRDLKPDNIVINERGQVVIIDYGLSFVAPHEPTNGKTVIAEGYCGTPGYISPEVIANSTGYDCRVDTYSLGIVFLEMFGGKTFEEYQAKASGGKFSLVTLHDAIKELESPERDIAKVMLRQTANIRPTAAKLLAHKYFSSYQIDFAEIERGGCTMSYTPPNGFAVMPEEPPTQGSFDRQTSEAPLEESGYDQYELDEAYQDELDLDHVGQSANPATPSNSQQDVYTVEQSHITPLSEHISTTDGHILPGQRYHAADPPALQPTQPMSAVPPSTKSTLDAYPYGPPGLERFPRTQGPTYAPAGVETNGSMFNPIVRPPHNVPAPIGFGRPQPAAPPQPSLTPQWPQVHPRLGYGDAQYVSPPRLNDPWGSPAGVRGQPMWADHGASPKVFQPQPQWTRTNTTPDDQPLWPPPHAPFETDVECPAETDMDLQFHLGTGLIKELFDEA